MENDFRQEHKYFLSPLFRGKFEADLRLFAEKDEHSSPEGYGISSVYFDNFQMRGYFDKIEGLPRRAKLRIRFYSGKRNKDFVLEIKKKILDYNKKDKLWISGDILRKMLTGELHPGETGGEKLDAFLVFQKANQLRPFIKIDYRRKAFFAKDGRETRITLDGEIKCRRFSGDVFAPAHIPVLPLGAAVVEIKTRERLPFWLESLIKKYSLKKRAISKYALSVQNLSANDAFGL